MVAKYSNESVARIVENEGLGYAVQDYMSGAYIEDEKLAVLWDNAKSALDAIDDYLDDYMDEDG